MADSKERVETDRREWQVGKRGLKERKRERREGEGKKREMEKIG